MKKITAMWLTGVVAAALLGGCGGSHDAASTSGPGGGATTNTTGSGTDDSSGGTDTGGGTVADVNPAGTWYFVSANVYGSTMTDPAAMGTAGYGAYSVITFGADHTVAGTLYNTTGAHSITGTWSVAGTNLVIDSNGTETYTAGVSGSMMTLTWGPSGSTITWTFTSSAPPADTLVGSWTFDTCWWEGHTSTQIEVADGGWGTYSTLNLQSDGSMSGTVVTPTSAGVGVPFTGTWSSSGGVLSIENVSGGVESWNYVLAGNSLTLTPTGWSTPLFRMVK